MSFTDFQRSDANYKCNIFKTKTNYTKIQGFLYNIAENKMKYLGFV